MVPAIPIEIHSPLEVRLHKPYAELRMILIDPGEACVITSCEMVTYGLWKDVIEASEKYLSYDDPGDEDDGPRD